MGKKIFSKDRKHKAGIELDIQLSRAKITVQFFDKEENLLKSIEVFSVRPDNYFIAKLIDKARWVNNSDFVLVNKDQEIQFKASLDKNTITLVLKPVAKTEEMLINDLLMLHADTGREDGVKLVLENIMFLINYEVN